MKILIKPVKLISSLAVALALTLRTVSSAQQTLEANPATVANEPAPIANPTEDQPNRLGLPKETLDRLSPDQIMFLARPKRPLFDTDLLVPILVPLGAFAMVVAIVALGVGHRLKQSRTLHETIRLMIEKGQPIPPELLQPQEVMRRPRSDLRRGLVFISIGIGLMGLLIGMRVGHWTIGLIPLLMGVAFLIAWKIESKKNDEH